MITRKKNFRRLGKTFKEFSKIIDFLKSCNGGFSRRQLEILGTSWPPKKGWKKEIWLKGTSEEKINKAYSLKNNHIKNFH